MTISRLGYTNTITTAQQLNWADMMTKATMLQRNALSNFLGSCLTSLTSHT